MTIINQKFKEFLSHINQFLEESNGNVWFRGHSNIGEDGNHEKYLLKSSIFRKNKNLNEIKRLEKNTLYEFMTKGYSLHQITNEWDLLYIMQHHGAPTRLLDWTNSLAVALYFATQNWNPGVNEPTIWLLNPVKLNKLTVGKESLIVPRGDFEKYVNTNTLKSYAIAPIYNSSRLIAQQGQFILQGNIN